MANTREETGYTSATHNNKRVPIVDFGKSVKADIAKKELRVLLDQLQRDSLELNAK